MLTNKQKIEKIERIANKLHGDCEAVYNLFSRSMNSIDSIIPKDISIEMRIALVGNLWNRFGDRLDDLIKEYEKNADK